MENFKKALNEVIEKSIHLSIAWDKLPTVKANEIYEQYPLEKDFDEIIANFIDWRDKLGIN